MSKSRFETRLDNDARAGFLQAISLMTEGVYSAEDVKECQELVKEIQDRLDNVKSILEIKTRRFIPSDDELKPEPFYKLDPHVVVPGPTIYDLGRVAGLTLLDVNTKLRRRGLELGHIGQGLYKIQEIK